MIVASFASTARFVWSRNRYVLIACCAIYLALFIASQIYSLEQVTRLLPPTLPLMRLATFFLPLFVLVGSVNAAALQLGGRAGHFPRLFFTLPIRAHEMVLPFIVYCAVLSLALWYVGALISDWRVLMLGPPGTPVEAEKIAYWVPFFVMSLLVWFQAVIWTPFAWGWLRLWVLLAVVVAHLLALHFYLQDVWTQGVLIAACLLQVPLAVLAAARGVARERRGISYAREAARIQAGNGAPSGDKASAADAGTGSAKRRPIRTFSRAIDAQLWFERRIHRWLAIPVFVLPAFLLVIFFLATVANTAVKSPEVYTAIARATLSMFFSLLLAIGVTTGLSFANYRKGAKWHRTEAFSMPPFFAALPMSTGDFAWAKITAVTTKMLGLSIAVLLACGWVADRAGFLDFSRGQILTLRQLHGDVVAGTMLAVPAFAVLLFVLSSTTNVMCMTLSGRAWNWLNQVNFARYAVVGIGAVIAGYYWGAYHESLPGLSEAIRVLAVLKIATLVVLVHHVGKRGLLSWSRLAIIVLSWLVTVAALALTAIWFLPEDRVSLLTTMAICILGAPVLGTVAAPLALQLNRTR